MAQQRSDVLIAAGRSVASFPVTTKGTFVGCLGQAGEVFLLPKQFGCGPNTSRCVAVIPQCDGRSHMQPQGSNWKEPTWSWAHSTGSPVSNEKLEAAAKAAWPYAIRCAWTYLYDHAAAYDLMDQALENASGYVLRHPECPEMKLAARIKSVIKRRARQQFAKQRLEIPHGSLIDMEKLYIGQPEAEQRVYGRELLERLSPVAQSIVNWRAMGYSWRTIAEDLEMDHTAVRRAYFREVESLLHDLSQPGELFQWI